MKIFKKILCTFLIVVMCLTSAPLDGFIGIEWPNLGEWFVNKANAAELAATGQCGDNVYWNYDSATGELVISGTGPMWGYDYDKTPFYNSGVKVVTIEDGVTSVGFCAFYNCRNITKVNLSKDLIRINSHAFDTCLNLTEISIPNSVIDIDSYSFSNCNSLVDIDIPDSVTTIGRQAFASCTKLTTVDISNSVQTISEGMFYNCTSLSNIIIPSSVTTIENLAFADCNCLTNIIIPNSVTTIENNAFQHCLNLTDINIPESITTISECLFINCINLASITITNSITTINDGAFYDCNGLTDVYFKGTRAQWDFLDIAEGNECLKKANIHFENEEIQTETLYRCRMKEYITSSNPTEEGYTYCGSGWSAEPTKTETVKYAKKWPSGSSATKGFKTSSDLYKNYSKPSVEETETTKTVLGDESNAKTVGYLYWHWCYSHSDTDDGPINCIIKDNIEGKIARYDAEGQPTGKYYITKNFHAFYTPSTLSFSSSAKAYKKSDSSKCKYTYWWSGLNHGKSGNIEVISNTLSTYEREYYHYKWSEWSEWSNIPVEETADVEVETMERELPLKEGKCGDNVTYTLNYDGTLIISGEGPMYDYGENEEANNLLFPPYVDYNYDETDEYGGFSGDFTIKKVIIKDGVTRIGNYAFQACRNLEEVEIADTVTYIGVVAFDFCTSLKHIRIPGSVKVLEQEAFSESALETIEIGNGLERVELMAFLYCQNLKKIALPESVEYIGDCAFILCDKLETLVINNKDCEIGVEILMTGELDEDGYPVEDENGNPIPTECPTVLKGYSGSTAEEYANTWTEAGYPIKFEVIEHKFVEQITFSATCTENGYTLMECSECGHEKKDDIVDPLGHDYSEKIIDDAHLVSKATYDSKAVYKYDCSRCESISTGTFEHGEKLVKVSSVSIKESTTIQKDKTEILVATVNPSNATNKKVTWKSSNTKVATVDNNGKVTAVAKGTATITATTEDGKKTDTCNVTVNVPVTGASLDKTSASVVVGKTCQLSVTVKPSDASNKNVIWSSSNTSVATVSSSGKVTAKAVGTATITVKTKDGSKTATCKVNVKDGTVKVTNLKFKNSKVVLNPYTCYTLNVVIEPQNATNKSVIWSSSNPEVVSVTNKGMISACKESGTAKITVKTKDGSKTATCEVVIHEGSFSSEKVEYKDTENNTTGTVYLSMKDSYFSEDSKNYNHELARLCSQFAVLGYGDEEAKDNDKAKYLRDALSKVGFKSWAISLRQKETNVNSFFASKDVYLGTTKYKLIFMGFIGSYKKQWYSNFKIGKTGTTHDGFEGAKNYAIGALDDYLELLKKKETIKKENTILLITGHSRGAAVANLVAADFIKNNKYANKERIFAYTFATPNVAASPDIKASNKTPSSDFSRIFNFVNPEDLVTKLIPNSWTADDMKFGRYGTTLVLPSATNETETSYRTYLSNMQKQFTKLVSGKTYEPFETGEARVYELMSGIRAVTKTKNDFYKSMPFNSLTKSKSSLYKFFQEVLCPIVAKEENLVDNYLNLGATALLLKEPFNDIADFFASYGLWEFADSHCAETYCAYMLSMSCDQAYTYATQGDISGNVSFYREPYLNVVNCPVDIEVYDKDTDELVGRIVDNVVDEEATSIVMYVDGDSKSFWLPSNGNYDVKLIGNDSGEMDYSVSVIDSDLGEVERINFLNVPVEEDFEYVGEFTEEDFSIDKYALTTELGETIEKTEKVVEEEFNSIDISVNVEGIGSVKGEGVYTSGDYITLEAVTDENNNFLGWYEEDILVSKEANLAFVVQENKTLTARFTDVYVEATGISISESEITLDDSDENSYVVLEATLTPVNATNIGFEWSSSDETVATVSEFGIVRAIGCGVATITVSSADGKLTGACTVTVKCNDHNISDDTIEVDATCTQAGYGYNTCKLCGYVENFTIEKYEHVYISEIIASTCSSNGYTINQCVACENAYTSDETEKLPHSFGDWYVFMPAKCTEIGIEQRDCLECDYYETQEISITGHDFDGSKCKKCDYDKSGSCGCNCHRNGIVKIIFKIILFFQKIFKTNKVCSCGVNHY